MPDLLNSAQIHNFIQDGFVRIDHAFSRATADAVVDRLWNDIPFDRHDAATWTEPVVRLGMYDQPPFIESVNSPELHHIFDQLIGAGNWIPCRNVGTFPVRFPSDKEPADTGWHVDASFPGADATNYVDWRVNVHSKGRALLMLVLYSDVTETDAPTVIRKGSHLDVAKLLADEGDAGLSFMELAEQLEALPHRDEVYAVGEAGSIYLCHPFLAHAAQANRGSTPKFMAQPPLLLRTELNISDSAITSAPVETAIRLALQT
ncbi:phytanoyl-CoA dioxygenase family protein [Spirosoma validum]|uniref:Phytanoyl-CoA dioxygenase family protein n=1 Tax=Spirosoma validum TaxID=2771355 RepID=A0A927GDT6_9BACT|nr:phytanoyl-CoA dioxygenase family protein [Spirosoma validum]MBD2754132.1 phytanoyl-CoA dioxygenase family protein [Spirosoma validum]